MDDPSQIFEAELAVSDELIRLRQEVADRKAAFHEALRLMKQMQAKCQRLHKDTEELKHQCDHKDVQIRELLRSRDYHALDAGRRWDMLWKVRASLWFRFLPKELQRKIMAECSSGR